MNFITKLNQSLELSNLLDHNFYKKWNKGKLTIDTLRLYANEYYHHVSAFPRYISQIHTLCPDIESRQILLDNLIEEEKGEENHPELWKRFAEGLGSNRNTIEQEPSLQSTKQLVDGYFNLVKQDYATGLGTLYAYERQTPKVSESKIEGLKKHYNIHDKKTLEFFNVHISADIWHTEELCTLINKLDKNEQDKAYDGATKGAKLLWHFLDGIETRNQLLQ
jgi:pyrroloquinoline-quinone synthase